MALVCFGAIFHPLFFLLGGPVGALQFALAAAGGLVLGPLQGALFGFIVALAGVPLWAMEHGLRLHEAVACLVLDPTVAWAAGRAAALLSRASAQAERLGRAERLLQAIFDTIPYHLFVVDERGRFLMVNRSLAADHGQPAEFFVGLDDIPGRTPEEQQVRREEDHQVISEGLGVDREISRHLPGGVVRQYHLTKRPLRDEQGNIVGLVGLAADITERKQEEAQRRDLEDQLRHAQRMEIVGQLAAGIAHDFNNLLTPILGQAEMIRTALPPGAVAEGAAMIEQAAQRAAELTRNLLAFGRKQVLEVRVLDLNREVGNLATMARRVIGSNIELRLHLAGGLGLVKADAAQMHQVLMNLLINSRDAMPAGGVAVIATENTELEDMAGSYLSDLKPGPYVTLSVSDTGHGMTAEVQVRIFEPFFTTKESGKGTGLGLATVWGIVKQHRGAIQVFSQPGVGTTFKMHLPRTTETAVAPPREALPAAPLSGTEDVLAVDDNTLVLTFVATVLAAQGYRVRQAESSDAALAIANTDERGFALLLTDLSMPKMNGIQLYRELSGRHPGLKVLYASGHPADLYPELMESRAPLLNKPFSARRLLAKVREVLDA